MGHQGCREAWLFAGRGRASPGGGGGPRDRDGGLGHQPEGGLGAVGGRSTYPNTPVPPGNCQGRLVRLASPSLTAALEKEASGVRGPAAMEKLSGCFCPPAPVARTGHILWGHHTQAALKATCPQHPFLALTLHCTPQCIGLRCPTCNLEEDWRAGAGDGLAPGRVCVRLCSATESSGTGKSTSPSAGLHGGEYK